MSRFDAERRTSSRDFRHNEAAALDARTTKSTALITWRLVQRDSPSRALRLTGPGGSFESAPAFVIAGQFPDQVAEFPSRFAAMRVLQLLRVRGALPEIAIVEEACMHAGLENRHLPSLLARVRDTAVCAAWLEADLTDPLVRGLAGLSAKAGAPC